MTEMARVQPFIRWEGVQHDQRVRLKLRNVLVAVNVRSVKMTKSLCQKYVCVSV